jgi:hypothetical protein
MAEQVRAGEGGEYSPDQISYWLAGGRCTEGRCNWTMLESAVEGGTGASGMGSGRGERMGLANLKADLERAADALPLYWQVTRTIFSRQHRYSVWHDRWTEAGSPETGPEYEQELTAVAFDDAIYRMSWSLGWREGMAA